MTFLTKINLPVTWFDKSDSQYELYLYRGDQEYPTAPGNKWHKLQHHLAEARRLNAKTIATFGGPFSNHLHAFGHPDIANGFHKVAIVRGELHPELTPTLKDIAKHGVTLWPSQRKDYALGLGAQLVGELNHYYNNPYWIPEGGGGELGALGCYDWSRHIKTEAPNFDAWVLAAGTGTTAAGFLANSMLPMLHVFSALKGAEQQKDDIINLARRLSTHRVSTDTLASRLVFHSDCHMGGYAKFTPEMTEFLTAMHIANPNLALDPVYTVKALYGVIKKMQRTEWPYKKTLFIHTGGLQGWRGLPLQLNPYEMNR